MEERVYEGFITIYDDTTIHNARLQAFLPNTPNKPKFDGIFSDSAIRQNETDLILLQPSEIFDITGASTEAPPFIKFEFTYNPEGTSTLYDLSTVYFMERGAWQKAMLLEARGYSMQDIDLGLVRTFYSSGSRYYKDLLEMLSESSIGSRSLSATELTTRIWMVIVADTLDPKAGKGCKQDMLNMTAMFNNIAEDMQLAKPIIRYIMGSNFNKRSLIDTLNRFLKPGANDIVIFYYTGHGYRLPNDQNDYPRMILSNNYTERTLFRQSMPMADVRRILQTKRESARLTFIINDCCNTVFPLPRLFGLLPFLGTRSLGSYVATHNFIKLFMEPRGIIQIGSSGKGEYSIGNPTIGGYYTTEFLASLNQSLSKFKREVSWNDICSKAAAAASRRAYTRARCNEGDRKVPCRQNPTYTLDIRLRN